MNSFNFIVSSTSTCGEKSVRFFNLDGLHFIIDVKNKHMKNLLQK
ncbi:hypothetical protein [Spiroplasma ixodetis]|nr:hypothetical protein [Spiroplasma ixodetis]